MNYRVTVLSVTHFTLTLVPRARHLGVVRQVQTVAVVALQRRAHVVVHLVVDLTSQKHASKVR